MKRKRLPSLATLSTHDDPLSDKQVLIERLVSAKSENRYLEWKLCPPIGPKVTTRAKYRMVKSVVSFANTDGGFVLFGVKSDGQWLGLEKVDLEHVDPAHITELINGCVFPYIPTLNYAEFKYKRRTYAIIHVPPSPLMPHVTTKQIVEMKENNQKSIILQKYAVYCRQGAKSDLATPSQHHKIIANRTEVLRSELLARIKEVAIPIPLAVRSAAAKGISTTLKVARITDDPNAPAVRLTRSKDDASGVFLHEELYDGLFEGINNVLDANDLIAEGRNEFLLGEKVYYRIYAERQHVTGEGRRVSLLFQTATHQFYAPYLYWLAKMPPAEIARILLDSLQEEKHLYMHMVIRLATLLGQELSDWLFAELDRKWHRYRQKPHYFWTFQKIRNRSGVSDVLLLAARTTATASISLPDNNRVTVKELLSRPDQAAKYLSEVCVRIFKGDKEYKSLSRNLDILAYGTQIFSKSENVSNAIANSRRN